MQVFRVALDERHFTRLTSRMRGRAGGSGLGNYPPASRDTWVTFVLLGKVEIPVAAEASGAQDTQAQHRFGADERPARAGAAYTVLLVAAIARSSTGPRPEPSPRRDGSAPKKESTP